MYSLTGINDGILYDPASAKSNFTEACDETNGYSNICTDEKGQRVRCRLCATCIGVGEKRYKRTGSGTKCKKCPDPGMNRFLLAIGFIVMLGGLSFLVYFTIRGEERGNGARGGKLSAIKKILLNFMQMVTLAASLPLEWPDAIDIMFQTLNTISSAGTALLIPDCELTHLRTSDAFYLKQIFYTFAIPLLIVSSITTWCFIYGACGRRWKLEWSKVKNRMILTLTLFIFLCYPMLIKLCLGMFKCVPVGEQRYLIADLQEGCFDGRHMAYVMLLSVPQLVVLTGLPILVFLLLQRNKKYLEEPQFRIRYGLLYRGYVKDREWWEVIVALRKFAGVAIGTFGSLIGDPETQVGLALFLGFISIVLHLVGQPFGSPNGESKRLHFMELYSLVVIWCTNWGGLMLYVSSGSGHSGGATRPVLTMLIIGSVCSYNIAAIYIFGKTLIGTAIQHRNERRSMLQDASNGILGNDNDVHVLHVSNHKIVPANNNNNNNDDQPFTTSSRHSEETVAEVDAVHDNFHTHERALKAEHARRQLKQRRATQNRVIARLKIRKTKALSKVPLFHDVPLEAIESILELTTYKKHQQNTIICTQDDPALEFYIIVSGRCAVIVKNEDEDEDEDEDVVDNVDSLRRVGTLKELDYFGESALIDENGRRNATVIAESEYVQVLMLSRSNFQLLLDSGALSTEIMSTMTQESERRKEVTRKSLSNLRRRSTGLENLWAEFTQSERPQQRRSTKKGEGGGTAVVGGSGRLSSFTRSSTSATGEVLNWKERLDLVKASDFRGGWRVLGGRGSGQT
jgi:CRP-like cAMP-binding protein